MIPTLALKSLWNRRLSTGLTVLAVALSVALLVGVERLRISARESFSNTISGTDLIVGAKGGSVQLLLYTVFHLGQSNNNVSIQSYDELRAHPAVEWTIPLSLGDSHRGFRVVATDANLYEHYRFRGGQKLSFSQGTAPAGAFDVALGAEVAHALGYVLGQKLVLAHGISEGKAIFEHGDKPFTVTGILNRTGTPLDRSLYITLGGMEAIHIDWGEGVPPRPGEGRAAESLRADELQPKSITAFLLRTKDRISVLRLQREVNDYPAEALLGIIPGVALAELWSTVGYAEDALRVVGFFVVLVGLLGMIVSLVTALNERRREMAILRALGASPKQIFGLLLFESAALGAAGAALGLAGVYALMLALRSPVEARFGLTLPLAAPSFLEWCYLGGFVLTALLAGLIPAVRALRNALADGLTLRV